MASRSLTVVLDDEPETRPLKLVDNPPNPFASTSAHWLEGMQSAARVVVHEDRTRTILAKNTSPDIGFSFSVNPYRGCQHACAYCYARPGHEYLSMGAGTDFDTQIVVKPDAPALLEAAFDKPSWRGEQVMFSGVTDCYQPLEASYRLTRGCLEVCARYKNPVGLITKSPLVERDIDVLLELQANTQLTVMVSIPFFDVDKARAIEPGVATPQRRLRTVETLANAGLRVGVMTAPIIPGLNDEDMPKVLEAAAAVGAVRAGYVLLRLPGSVAGVFEHRLRAAFPLRADKIMRRIAETRGDVDGDRLYDSRWGVRQTGVGSYAQMIHTLFSRTVARLGLNNTAVAMSDRPFDDGTGRVPQPTIPTTSTFQRPEKPKKNASPQLTLF